MDKNVNQRISVSTAARMLGCREQEIRIRMQRGTWDLGYCIPATKGHRAKYYIYLPKLLKHIGMEAGNEQS